MNTNYKYEPKHITVDDIKNGCVSLSDDKGEDEKLYAIQEEFHTGIDAVKNEGPSVTFYGSARLQPEHPEYVRAYKLAKRIGEELGYTIITGGGGGIMEAANKGAYDAKVKSIGLTIRLPNEQATNKYVTKEVPFHFFFTRQVSMSYTTEVCVFCAGGTGTMYEFFEILTHLQTGKIGPIPVILYGSEYWNSVIGMVQKVMVDKYHTISQSDLDRFTITDDEDLALEIIKKSKMRNGDDDLIIE